MAFCSPASISPPETCCTIDQALLLLQKAANLDQCLTFHLLVISLDLHALKPENEMHDLDPLSFQFALRFCYSSCWSGEKFWDKFSKATSNLECQVAYVGKASGQLKKNVHPTLCAELRSPLDLIHQISGP